MANQGALFGDGVLLSPSVQQDIDRRKQFAQALQQQAMQPLDVQPTSGIVPRAGVGSGLMKLAQAFIAGKAQDSANQASQKAVEDSRTALAKTLQDYSTAIQGTPAQTAPSLVRQPNEDGSLQNVSLAGEAPDRNKAIAILAQNPQTAPIALQMQLSSLQPPKWSTDLRYDQNGKAFVLSDKADVKFLDGIAARDKLENVNGVWSDPYSGRTVGVAPQDLNQPFFYGPDGKPAPNTQYQNYQITKSRAGAPNVSVNTATKPFLAELGKGAGEAVNNAYQGALAANQTLQNVNQIRQGLGNAIIGPGANARVTLAQIGQTLGVTGKDTAEQLQNTRNVMQGLARQELAAASQMRGQGQITESERNILRKAEAGDIASMTAPEITTFLNAVEKTARYRIAHHQQNVERLRQDPNAAPIVDYMQVNAPPPVPAPASRTSVTAPKFLGFE